MSMNIQQRTDLSPPLGGGIAGKFPRDKAIASLLS